MEVYKFLAFHLIHLLFLFIYFLFYQPKYFIVFWITLLKAVFAASIHVFVAVSINFLPYSSPIFLANYKKSYTSTYFLFFGSVEYCIYILYLPHNKNHANITFNFNRFTALFSKTNINKWKFCVNCIQHYHWMWWNIN